MIGLIHALALLCAAIAALLFCIFLNRMVKPFTRALYSLAERGTLRLLPAKITRFLEKE